MSLFHFYSREGACAGGDVVRGNGSGNKARRLGWGYTFRPLDGGQAVYALVNLITGRAKFAARTSCFIVVDMFFNVTGLLGQVYIGGLFSICLTNWIISSMVNLFANATRVITFRATTRMIAEERENEAAKRTKTHKGEAAFQVGHRYMLATEAIVL